MRALNARGWAITCQTGNGPQWLGGVVSKEDAEDKFKRYQTTDLRERAAREGVARQLRPADIGPRTEGNGKRYARPCERRSKSQFERERWDTLLTD
jgi:hypothetical protein